MFIEAECGKAKVNRMKEYEEKIMACVSKLNKPLYVSRLVTESGETVLTVSERPFDEIMSRWSGTHQRVRRD